MYHRSLYFIISFLLITFTFIFIPSRSQAETRSRIAGSIIDADTGEPVIGANVIIKETLLGAATDQDGVFLIVNVPVGTYDLEASMIGYQTLVMKDVRVSMDRVAKVDFLLSTQVIEGEEIVVIATRDELHKEVSNTQMVVDEVQLNDATGIREINAFLTRLPGVSEDNGYLSIRGGSADQTGMMVNGLSYNNAAAGYAESSIPLSAIEQVSLMSGGYNAEYGNFRSGLINVTTKSGHKTQYHGTLSLSMDLPHIRRFGDSFYDPYNHALRSYLDPAVAFIGTEEAWKDDKYARGQYPTFDGWNYWAENYNISKPPEEHATPLDYLLLAHWMHMAEPDYDALAKQGYTVSDEQKQLFADHRMEEDASDWNVDAGFGGPIPFFSRELGDATFYISHNARERHYIMPVTRSSEELYTTFGTIKTQPTNNLSISLNGLIKRQMGMSPIRPAWGDFPDASREGGFMPMNNIKYVANNPEYWYDAPFFPELNQTSLMLGVSLNQILSEQTFWELSLSVMTTENSTNVGNNRDQSVLTYFGPFPVSEMPYGKLQYGSNDLLNKDDSTYYRYPSYDALPGVPRRFRRKEGDLYDNTKVGQYRAKADITTQWGRHHYIKAGIEYNYFDINHKFWEKWNENYYNVYEFNYHRTPSQTGIYLQDQISFESIVANLGLRVDYYYGGGDVWPTGDPFADEVFVPQSVANDTILFNYLEQGKSYIWDTWVAYDKEHPGFLQPIKNHFTFSPRIGIAFPVTETSKFYFNYGHFRSNPPYYTMYLYRYRYDKNGLYDMSNPNLEPPRTISYELGMAYNFYDSYVLRVSGYLKDVSGQHGEVNFQNSQGTLDYDAWANNEYEDIRGIEVNLAKNDNSWITGWLNFNYMLLKSGLTGREVITDITINDDREGLYNGQMSRSLPRPELNLNVTLRSPKDWGPDVLGMDLFGSWTFTFFGEWQKGRYFTWNPLNEKFLENNMNWPDYYMLDLKVAKTFEVLGVNSTFYVDISNVLNLKVSQLHRGYAFDDNTTDERDYLASLRLSMYDSPEFDVLREVNQSEGWYIPGDDEVGDMRSAEKPYINDPNFPFWAFGEPRNIWLGLRLNF